MKSLSLVPTRILPYKRTVYLDTGKKILTNIKCQLLVGKSWGHAAACKSYGKYKSNLHEMFIK